MFRTMNVSGSWQLSKIEIYRGLADHFGDMGFTEAEWENMFALMESTPGKDESYNF